MKEVLKLLFTIKIRFQRAQFDQSKKADQEYEFHQKIVFQKNHFFL